MSASLRRWRPGGVRLRTTLATALVVLLAFAAGGAVLALALFSSLQNAAESTAAARADALVETIRTGGVTALPAPVTDPDAEGSSGGGGGRSHVGDDPDGHAPDDEGPDDEGPDDDVSDLAWQVIASDGSVAGSAGTGTVDLPRLSGEATIDGDAYVVRTRAALAPDGDRHLVAVAVSLDDAEDSVDALLPVLGVGIPLAVLFVAGTTWVVVGRALRPVERIRSEVAGISAAGLHQRVPVPSSRDEIARLAQTMNAMLDRLEESAVRQRRFVSDTSHELRSPLASLRQTAEVAQAHPDAVPQEELTAVVLDEAARMQHLVDQMLVLTRTAEGGVRRTEVDLDDLVLAEVSRLRRLRSDLEVEARRVEAARVVGDAGALAQVVRNLADNAARHARTRLSFSLRAGERVELLVEDDGAGVPEADRERVFDRFVRLDEARARDSGGSGLGLAIVREVTTAHGGTASVDGSALGGARFRVELPAAPAPS